MTDSGEKTDLVSALSLHDGDNVAVMAGDGIRGGRCVCELPDGTRRELLLTTDVSFGHKVSIEAFKVGDVIRKYGQPIGVATQTIPVGAHVHVHNLAGYRQDLVGGKS